MSRTLWFVAGAGAGVYAISRVRRVAEALTPEGIADRLAALSVGLRLFRDEVQTGMAEKEMDLRKRPVLALPGTTRPELSGAQPAPADRPPDNSAHSAPQTKEGND